MKETGFEQMSFLSGFPTTTNMILCAFAIIVIIIARCCAIRIKTPIVKLMNSLYVIAWRLLMIMNMMIVKRSDLLFNYNKLDLRNLKELHSTHDKVHNCI